MVPGPTPTAVIVDDHPAIVEGVRGWCAAADPPIHVVDAGDSPSVALTGAGADADVVVFDLFLGPTPELAALRALLERGRRVVVYSQDETPESVVRCVEMGVLTYLAKSEGAEHLVAAVHAAVRGERYTGPMLGGVLAGDRRPDRPALSAREREVLLAWFESESKNLVAHRLHLSVKTVDTYITRVRAKYADAGRPASSKAALVARALQDGLVGLGEL
ncbi:LuxR family two component transcriptional regulator [Pseudonocardia sediminis]|uniref:LuxR family two component transcriptional regulator n=1 Tax=Pseudonocardia sediminis TaxID=1397368 RepID=A0A4V2FQF8_PSEST|nr:response regulator transcription factor [Pseudonocardia sediminis]RZT83930.1 LuxR family two component transcriptional regulator [Pseudonocardia sediminis]